MLPPPEPERRTNRRRGRSGTIGGSTVRTKPDHNHTPYPGESADVFRVEIAPERGAHMETLAIYFPVVLRDQAVMRVHWGETILPVRIRAPYRPDAG